MRNKGYFKAMLLFMFASISTMKAENTDISGLQHVLYVEPLTVQMGATQVTLSVKMKNYYEAMGFSFGLRLPENFSFATDESGDIDARLSNARTDETHVDFFQATQQSDGSLSVVAYNDEGDGKIDGNDGEIALVCINLPADATAGNYTITILNPTVSLSTGISKHEINEVETTLTLATTSKVILEETSVSAPSAATGVDVLVKRSIKANEWSTICLPFAMTEAQVKEAFGSDVQLGDFNGYETTEDDGSDITGITVKFNSATAIEANHPYIIKVSEPMTEFTVDGVDIDPEETPTKAAVKRTKKQWSEMIGTYVANTPVGDADEEAWCLFLSGNQFWYSMGQTKMKAFRAYFDFYDVISSVENASAPVFISFESDVTGIKSIQRSTDNDRYYNMNGQRVMSPKKGLYIKNNKKVIVK